jgi:hypothetical protein
MIISLIMKLINVFVFSYLTFLLKMTTNLLTTINHWQNNNAEFFFSLICIKQTRIFSVINLSHDIEFHVSFIRKEEIIKNHK